jgi:pimeloyl-ACP methyl ester carboxylesterase
MAINFPDPQYVRSNGIRLAYYEMGEGFPIVLCHGFPELAFSWHKVMPALAEAGFCAIAVDQRGYGNS